MDSVNRQAFYRNAQGPWYASSFALAQKDLSKALENYATQSEEVDAIRDANFDDADTYRRELLDLRFELKEYLSREEWQQVFSGTQEIDSAS